MALARKSFKSNNKQRQQSTDNVKRHKKRDCKADEEVHIVSNVAQVFGAHKLSYSSTVQLRFTNSRLTAWKNWLSTCTNLSSADCSDSLLHVIKSGGELVKCALFASEAVNSTCVKAIDNISTNEYIGIFAGNIWVESEFAAKHAVSDRVWSIDIPAVLLPTGYSGEDLLIESNSHGNISRFIRHPSGAGRNCRSNIEVVITCLPEYDPGVFIVLRSKRSIERGEEILCSWGDHTKDLMKKIIETKSRKSLLDHFYLLSLIKNLKRVQTKLNSIDILTHSRITSEDETTQTEVLKCECTSRLKRKRDSQNAEVDLPKKRPKPSDFVRVNPEEAFRYSNCKVLREVHIDLLPETINLLATSQRIRTLEDVVNKFYSKDSLVAQQIIDGYAPKCYVTEVLSLKHPARRLAPPCFRSFALCAKEDLEQGEPIGLYIGRVIEENRERDFDQTYAYGMDCRNLGYNGPDLVLENKTEGNECRFINDCYCRENGESSVNAVACVVWAKKQLIRVPVVLFHSKRRISANEEIVISYGEQYWDCIAPHISAYQSQFQATVSNLVENFLQVHSELSIPIPDRADRFPEHFEQFTGVYENRAG